MDHSILKLLKNLSAMPEQNEEPSIGRFHRPPGRLVRFTRET
jgi:hypothetical protein